MQFLIPLPVLLSTNNIKTCQLRLPQTHESIKKLQVWVKLELSVIFLSVCDTVSLGRRLVPWIIVDVQSKNTTFQNLFIEMRAGHFQCVQVGDELKCATVSQVVVGRDKGQLMITSATQSVFNVCKEFGKCIKLVVEIDEQAAESSLQSLSTTLNNFQIVFMAQRQLQQGDNGAPFGIPVKTNKGRMYIDLVCLIKELGARWTNPNAYAVPFLNKLCDMLWYINVHYNMIGEWGCKVPNVFAKLFGYNCPEKHKHRNRALENLRSLELQSHSLSLQDLVQASWFQRECFKQLKQATEGLMMSLNSYAEYFQEKVKYQKLHHQITMQPSPLCNDTAHVKVVPKASTPTQSSLVQLQDVLLSKEVYEPVCLVDFTPGDRRQQYKWVLLCSLDLSLFLTAPLSTHMHTPHTHTLEFFGMCVCDYINR